MSMAVELWAMRLERPADGRGDGGADRTAAQWAAGAAGTDPGRGPAAGAALCLLHLTQGGVGTVPLQELPPLALTEQGKPYFPDVPAVHFSLSHTNGAVLAALSAAPVGVDVERLRPVGTRIMHRLADTQDPTAFFDHWVRREALTKQNGMGVGASLHREPAAQAGVRCQALDLFPGYAAAVASEEAVGTLRRYTLASLLEPWMQERSIT